MNTITREISLSAVALSVVLAQSLPPTASLSGRVLSEDGRALPDANGAFSFSRLPAGTYKLCAQIAATEPAPANAPWVDTCLWPSPQPPVTVAAGQQVAGIVFTAPK